MALWKGALVALAELGSVPITHIVVHNHLELQFLRDLMPPSDLHGHQECTQRTCRPNMYMHKIK